MYMRGPSFIGLSQVLRSACAITLLTVLGVRGTTAQSSAPFSPRDQVIVLARQLPVHVGAGSDSGVAAEVIRGMNSHILAIDQDTSGSWWVYLADNAYGWVQAEANNQHALALFSDETQGQIVDQANAAISANPADVDAFAARATVALSRRDYAAAVADFAQAVQLSPSEGRFYDYRGKAYLDSGNYAQALTDFQNAIGLGDIVPNLYNRAAIAYDDQNLPQAAITFINLAISAEPGYGLLYSNRANFYGHLESMSDREIADYTTAISYDPYLATAYANRGLGYRKLGDNEAAMADYNTALQIDPDNSQAYVNRGVLYGDVYHDQVDALADLNHAVEADPYNSRAYSARGVTNIFLGNTEAAISDLKQALALDRHNQSALFNLASLYGSLGRYTDGIDAYNRATDSGDRFDTSAPLYRSQLYHAIGDDQSALNDINTFLETHGGRDYFTTVGFLIRANLNLYQGDYASADNNYRAALALQGDFVIQYQVVGAGYRVTPLRENMISDFRAQITASPQNANLYLQEANLYMEFGRWSEAVQAYHQYMNLTPDSLPELAALVATLEQYFL
jgi:tetratricopeptide (TPR) repeat protein